MGAGLRFGKLADRFQYRSLLRSVSRYGTFKNFNSWNLAVSCISHVAPYDPGASLRRVPQLTYLMFTKSVQQRLYCAYCPGKQRVALYQMLFRARASSPCECRRVLVFWATRQWASGRCSTSASVPLCGWASGVVFWGSPATKATTDVPLLDVSRSHPHWSCESSYTNFLAPACTSSGFGSKLARSCCLMPLSFL